MSATSTGHYSDEYVAELLTQYAETGDSRLRDSVVVQMRPLVRHVARKFAGKEPIDDLEGEGYIGLIRAVDRFTPGKGTRFSTFATHLIAGQIRHYLRDRGHLIRQPAWLQELNSKIQRASAELEQRLQREPTVQELAAVTNVTEEGIEELLAAQSAARILRLDSASSDEEDFLDVDPEKIRTKEYQTLTLPLEDRIVLEHALEKLKELERLVLENFFFGEFNQSEIARKLGISCNYTGYLLRNGLKHMRERLPHESDKERSAARPGEESVVDRATGVYTRAYFEKRLAEEIRRAQFFSHSVAVCCIRLPEDSSAHALEAAASALRSETRRADVVARTGKREFSVIFPNTSHVVARVAARLGEEVHQACGLPVHVSSSSYPDSGRTPTELYEAAAKGPHQIGASSPSPPTMPTRAFCG